jgi:serine/threonine protein kinase
VSEEWAADRDPRWRAERAHRIAEECVRRRAAGERLSDEEILGQYSDLTGELRPLLAKLGRIARAREAAAGKAGDGSSTRPGLLEAGASGLPGAPDPAAEQDAGDARESAQGVEIPGYELLHVLGRGGQAVVHQALQRSTGRVVALKISRDGLLGSASERARFEREVRILSQLRHPNIVPIHDSGRAAGIAYFVMEYIAGQRLDHWVSGRERDVCGLLELFLPVCDAVAAAHLQGIIHRDLKPSNILVDISGTPHILDFGLAKHDSDPAEPESADVALTQTGQFVGSLPWASPEQASGESARVDLRTDVYSLGVVLYQILAGRFPYELTGGARHALETIRGTPPAPLRTVAPWLDEEIRTIVLKCLSKERERRYQSAGELARDIRRYLADEPIEAQRDSGWYILRKMLRRHWAATAVAAAFLVLLSGSAVTVSFLYQSAAQQEKLATRRGDELADTLRESELRRTLALRERAKARAASEFLQKVFLLVTPEKARTRDTTLLREMLDEVAASMPAELAGQPDVEVVIREVLGQAHAALLDPERAGEHFRAAVQLQRELLSAAPGALAVELQRLGQRFIDLRHFDEGQALLQESLGICRGTFGEESVQVRDSLAALGHAHMTRGYPRSAEDHFRLVLALCERHEATPQATEEALLWLTQALSMLGRMDQVVDTRVRLIELRERRLGPDHASLAPLWIDLSIALDERQDYAGALAAARRAAAIGLATGGRDDPARLTALDRIVLLAARLRDFELAQATHDEVLDQRRHRLGHDHPDVLIAGPAQHAMLAMEAGDHVKAVAAALEAVRQAERIFGSADPRFAEQLAQLAEHQKRAGQPAEAESSLLLALDVARTRLGDVHERVANILDAIGMLRLEQGRALEAEAPLTQALEIRARWFGQDHFLLADCWLHLGQVRWELGDAAGGEAAMRRAIEVRRAAREKEYLTSVFLNALAARLVKAGRAAEAAPLYDESLELYRGHFGPRHGAVAWCEESLLGPALEQAGDFEGAAGAYREAIDIRAERGEAQAAQRGQIALARCEIRLQRPDQAAALLNELMASLDDGATDLRREAWELLRSLEGASQGSPDGPHGVAP